MVAVALILVVEHYGCVAKSQELVVPQAFQFQLSGTRPATTTRPKWPSSASPTSVKI